MKKQKDTPITKEEINFLEKYTDDLFAETLTKKEQNEVFKDLSKIDGLEDFLKSIVKNDRITYFNSPKEAQDQVKGACYRTIWLLRGIQALKQGKEKAEKLVSPRHQ